jgi:single-strand DNA-binding protein
MNLNKVIIIGRTTSNPEMKSTKSGKSVVSMSIATNRYYKTSKGEKQEEVEFHNVVFWGKQAEIVSQYVEKGQLLMVEGRLNTRNWETKQGIKRYTTEIIAEGLQLGPSKNGSKGESEPKKSDNVEDDELEQEAKKLRDVKDEDEEIILDDDEEINVEDF